MKEVHVTPSTDDLRAILARDDVESLKHALDKGLNPKSWLDANPGEAILAIAIREDSARCVRLLLEADGDWALGASFNEDFDPPLAIAVESGSDQVLALFIESGIIEKYPDQWLQNAIEALMDRKEYGESVVAFLESLNLQSERSSQLLADPSFVKFLGRRARECSKSSRTLTLRKRWSAVARALQAVGSRTGVILEEVEMLAANGHKSRIEKILTSLPSELRSEAAGRALVYAAGLESWDFADDLIAMGADCTVKLADGSTALMNAARGGNLGLIRKLLAGGADLYAREDGPRGKNAIEKAQSPVVRRYLENLAARGGRSG